MRQTIRPHEMIASNRSSKHSLLRRLGRFALLTFLWIIAGGAVAWAFGALFFDFPVLRGPVAWGFLLGVLAVLLVAHAASAS
jgi:hypothetical protein